MRILKAGDHRRMAWRNGGGETIEVAVHPAGAGLADFDWRVSMARVAGDGAFSVFPGIDRTLVVLDGEGLALEIEGIGLRVVSARSEPLRFPADAPTAARLLDGPIVDLNVMTRRPSFGHRVERIVVGDRRAIRPGARWTLLMPFGPIAVEEAGGRRHELSGRDALVLDGGEAAVEVSAGLPQDAVLVEIEARPDRSSR